MATPGNIFLKSPSNGEVRIKNLHYGLDDTDAVNIGQLNSRVSQGINTRVSFYDSSLGVVPSGVEVLGPSNDQLRVDTLYSMSDARNKDNIMPIESTDKLMDLKPSTYMMKNSGKDGAGLIAQELEEHFPEMVETDKKGFKSVNYIMLIPYILKHIQDLTQKVEDLQQKLNE